MTYYNVNKTPSPENLRVLLDGKEVEGVFECDTREGWLLKYVRREGRLVIDKSDPSGVATEKLYGVVQVVPVKESYD